MVQFVVGKRYRYSTWGPKTSVVCRYITADGSALMEYDDGMPCVAGKRSEGWTEYVEPLKVGDRVKSTVPQRDDALSYFIIAEVGDNFLIGPYSNSRYDLALYPKKDLVRA